MSATMNAVKHMPAPFRWAALCIVFIVALAALFLAWWDSAQNGQTAQRGVNLGNCVNNILSLRNGPARADAQAHIKFAQADEAYDTALLQLLLAPRHDKAAELKAYRHFIVAAQSKTRADDAYVHTLVADQAFRDAHPLGRC